MAFQRTKGRSVYTQPTGMPDLSGFKRAAQMMGEVGKMTYNLGTELREQNLNSLILEAEAEGRTAGATYDADNNLVPLTNLNVSSAIEKRAIGEKEKETLKQYYRKAAMQTYMSSVQNDAEKFAKGLLAEFPNDPDKIRGGLAGYLEGFGDDEEILSYIKPIVVSEFVSVESTANAQQILDQRKATETQNLQAINGDVSKLSVLINKGPAPEDEGSVGQNKMISELLQSIEGKFEALQTIGYDDNKIQGLRDTIDATLTQRAMESHISKFYEANDYSEVKTLEEIQRISQTIPLSELDGDKSVRSEVEVAMSNQLTKLKEIRTAQISEDTKRQKDNFEDAALGILLYPEAYTLESIMNLDVGNDQMKTLVTSLNTVHSAIGDKKKAAHKQIEEDVKENFEMAMLPFYDDFSTQEARIKASETITAMLPFLKASERKEFVTKLNEWVKKPIKENAISTWAELDLVAQNELIETSVLVSKIDELRENGLVGNDKTLGQKTEEEVVNIIQAHDSKRKTFIEKQEKIADARNRRLHGDFSNKDDATILAEEFAWELKKDPEGNTIYHQDEYVREENLSKAIKFTLAYNVLHPDVENALKGLGSIGDNEDAFKTKVQLFDVLFSSVRNGSYKKGQTDFKMGELLTISLFDSQGINVHEYQTAKEFGFVKFREMKAISESDNAQRITRNLENEFGSLRQGIQENYYEAINSAGWRDLLKISLFGADNQSEELDFLMSSLADSVPPGLIVNGDASDAIIADERLFQMIESSVMKQFATKNLPVSKESLQFAIKYAIAKDIGKNIGINVDSQGQAYWTTSPWYNKAVESIGDSIELVKAHNRSTTVADIVFQDVKFKAMNIPGGGALMNNRLRELLEGDGVISLEPNLISGQSQSYRAVVSNPDDRFESYTILPDYRFNWGTSVGNAAYLAAEKRVRNSTIRNFIANAPVFGQFANQAFINRQITNIIGDLKNDAGIIGADEPENWTGLMETFQSIMQDWNPFWDETTDQTYDVGDVKVLRDFMSGDFGKGDYIKKLDEYYEQR